MQHGWPQPVSVQQRPQPFPQGPIGGGHGWLMASEAQGAVAAHHLAGLDEPAQQRREEVPRGRFGQRHAQRLVGRRNVAAAFVPPADERGPDGDVETLEFFAERVGAVSKMREDVKTWFDYLDLDDHVTFGGKP